jgi:hypothetical protein
MASNNNNPIEKVKDEIENAKEIITNADDKNKSVSDKVKSIVTPKNDSKNINNDSENNEKENAVSDNISNIGNGGKHNESANNENVTSSNNTSNNSNTVVSNLDSNMSDGSSDASSNNGNNSFIESSSSTNVSASSNDSSINDSFVDNSSEETADVEILDELSKSCQLAMSNISFLSTKAIQKNIKKELVSIYSGYTDILSQINKNFELLGEIPSNVSPSLKMFGLCSINLNTKIDKSSSHIAEIMIQGLNMGIIKCQKLLNSSNSTIIKEQTLNLVKQFLNFQEQSIQKLKAFL